MKPALRPRLLDAREMLGAVFAILDDAAAELEEPERGAALEARADCAALARRLNALCLFVPGGAPPSNP